MLDYCTDVRYCEVMISKGQAFECFHCYKQAHVVIACCAYCLFFISLYFCFRSCLLYIFVYMYFFSFDATIFVNKDVYIAIIVNV